MISPINYNKCLSISSKQIEINRVDLCTTIIKGMIKIEIMLNRMSFVIIAEDMVILLETVEVNQIKLEINHNNLEIELIRAMHVVNQDTWRETVLIELNLNH